MAEIDHLAEKIRRVIRLLIRQANAALPAGSPTRSEQGVLAWLDERVEMTPGDLAVVEKVRPQTMGQTLDSLDRRGWIVRRPHSQDRRRVVITLSGAGRKALQSSRGFRQAWLVTELHKLSAKDRQSLAAALAILDRMVSN